MDSSLENEEFPYRYYVTYTANRSDGFVRGAIDIERAAPISSFEQLEAMSALIAERDSRLSDIVISGWQRYEEDDGETNR